MLHNVRAVVLLENTSYITHMQLILYMGTRNQTILWSHTNKKHKPSHTSEVKRCWSRAQAGDVLWWSQGSSHLHTAWASCAQGPSTALACASLLPSNTQVVPLPHATSTNTKLPSHSGDVGYSTGLWCSVSAEAAFCLNPAHLCSVSYRLSHMHM